MNLLQSLAMRTLDTAPAIEPPRIPYVDVFPDEQATPSEVGTEPEAPPFQARPAAPAVPQRADGTPEEMPGVREGAAVPPHEGPDPMPPREGHADATPEIAPTRPPAERIVERGVERTAEASPPPATPPQRPEPASEDRPAEPAVTREVRHTHHHHWLERRLERTVPEIQPAPAAPSPAARTVEPGPVRPAAEAAPPPPQVRPAVRPPAAARAPVDEERPTPPEVPPLVNVTIGRVTVRVQPPAAAQRSETTRPTAPSVDLAAYTAARRRQNR